MSKIKALLMALILLVGGLYVWKIEQEEKQAAQLEVEKRKIFPEITEDKVKLISATSGKGSFRTFRRGYRDNKETTSEAWVLNSPDNAPADMGKIKNIIFALLNLESKNVIQADELLEDQAQYGLVPPELVLTFEGTFGRKVFSFGKKVAASSRRYMQPQDEDRIFLVDDSVFANLDISVQDLCDKKPLKVEAQNIKQAIFLADPDNFIRLDLNSETNIWTISNKYKKLIPDQELINNKIAALTKLTAKYVIDAREEKLSVYGLKKPLLTVSLVDKEENPLSFQIGEGISIDALNLNPEANFDKENLSIERAYYLRILGSSVVYQMKHSYFSNFLQDLNFFRTRTPFKDLAKMSLEKFSLNQDNKSFSLLEHAESDTLLQSLINLKVISYSTLKDEEKNEVLKKVKNSIELKVKNSELNYKIYLGDKLSTTTNANDQQSPYWLYWNTEDGETLAAVVRAEDYSLISNIIVEIK
ncbi:MAG: DUF4340 domain-containing protein [Proteobacteria bacterium]|nr:DUF4340 domain-containing protein [Pseudomonadota bacterium]